MDILITNVVVLLTYGVLTALTTIGPLLIVPMAIWIGLWVFEIFVSAFPLVGKPLGKSVHWLRKFLEKLTLRITKWALKPARWFVGAVGRGLKIVGKKFFSAVGRGIVRIKDIAVAKLKRTLRTP